MANRVYDVVLYGASGFTGKQTVRYFAEHAPLDRVRWAIAGRDQAKLETVKRDLGVANVEVLVADSRDQTAVDKMVAQAGIVLSTAGPFALYSDAVVDACVRLRTHYVDITGETPWVRDLIDRYHERAAADGTRIIPFCGFDSVPSDLGAYLVARYMQREWGVTCRVIKAYFQMAGGLNGGTMATMFNIYDSGQAARARELFLLNPDATPASAEVARNQDPTLPVYDQDIAAWAGPFFMGPINTRVVRRSAALFAQWQEAYGGDFSYQEYMKFDGPLGLIMATGLTAGTAIFNVVVQTPLRSLIKPLLPPPGAGPSERTMNEGWFRCDLVGVAADNRKVRGVIRDQGDPGNRATVKFVCEGALSLAFNADQLPGGAQRGGVLTPATGLGDVLAKRLRTAGMIIEIGS
jgi:short subunit dehydrogenase-like uncharacterized protein